MKTQHKENDFAKAESRNAALASQLANITPQLTSLETKLSTLTTQLNTETQRRITAENACEEAENKLRNSEGTLDAVRSSELRKLKEESEALYEKLAFVEGEAEDYRNELEGGRERHREEMEEMRGDLDVLRAKLKKREEELQSLQSSNGNADTDYFDSNDVGKEGGDELFEEDDTLEKQPASPGTPATPPVETESSENKEEYIRTLEEELELVTEQLITTETKLSHANADLEMALQHAEDAEKALLERGNDNAAEVGGEVDPQLATKISELEATVKLLQEENELLNEESKRITLELETALEGELCSTCSILCCAV